MSNSRSVAVFDLGGVLIEWNPRYLYRRLFQDDMARMEDFLANVCHSEWNRQQDAGRSFAEAEAEAIARHPDKSRYIRAWFADFREMIPGPISAVVDILRELRNSKVPLYALTNWSCETFAPQLERFDFLSWFDGIVVSGQEKLIKPDPRIFHVLMRRYGIDPSQAAFIDDAPANVATATELGFHGIHFTSPDALRSELAGLLLL
jgi:2-haloacid dehalogenase